jgi:hypothetical protein
MTLRLLLLLTLGSLVTHGCSCSDSTKGDPDGEVPDAEVPACPDGTPRGEVVECLEDGIVYSCGDGCGNDGDGLVDLDDPDCEDVCHDGEGANRCPDGSLIGPQTVCGATGLIHACGDGCDNDGDGFVDLDDPTCGGNPCHVSESVPAGGGGEHAIAPCGDVVYQCGNGIDDDDDGLIDSDDPNCLGPCDNNESGYYPDIPGGIGGAGNCTFQCYFNDNSGNSYCLWDVQCDPLSPGESWGGKSCDYNESQASIDCEPHFNDQLTTRPGCEDDCLWRLPGGCDCFGCCAFPTAADPGRHLFISSRAPGTVNKFECTHEEAVKEGGSPLCAECTPVPSCYKGCEDPCALCLGQDPSTLPEHCTPEQRCTTGEQACGQPGDAACPDGFFCLTGCCVYFGTVG